MKRLKITFSEKARRVGAVRAAEVNAAIEGQKTPKALKQFFPAFERGEIDATQVVEGYRVHVTSMYGNKYKA